MRTLPCSIDDVWRGLVRGGADPKHDWHWPTLATVGLHGEPDARTVVLRSARPLSRELEIHSDSRAGKLAQLNASNGRALLHCYDSRSRTQLRIRCSSSVHVNDATSAAAWEKLSPTSRAQYVELVAELPQEYFAVIVLQVKQIDWLWLAREGHQRQLFTWDNGWSAQELKP